MLALLLAIAKTAQITSRYTGIRRDSKRNLERGASLPLGKWPPSKKVY